MAHYVMPFKPIKVHERKTADRCFRQLYGYIGAETPKTDYQRALFK
jgi:hypothetical protein